MRETEQITGVGRRGSAVLIRTFPPLQMSLIVEVKIKSRNGMPLETLKKAMVKHGKALIENVNFCRFTRAGYAVYDVSLHDSVNPNIEKAGK